MAKRTVQVSLPQATPYGADPYQQAAQQAMIADELRKRAMTNFAPQVESRGQSIARGMTQLGQALLARRAAQQATAAQTGADAQTRRSVDTGIENLAGATQIDDVDGGAPTPILGGASNPALSEAVQQRLAQSGQQSQGLHAALDNVDPRVGQQIVSQALLARAMPQKPVAPKYSSGGNGLIFNEGTGAVAREPDAKTGNWERKTRLLDKDMAQDYDFNPVTREEKPVGDPYKHKDPSTAAANAAAAGALTGDALKNAAERYRQTGQLPSLGMGNGPLRVKIINQAAELSALEGDDAKAAAMKQQANKAAQAALAQITKQKTVTGAFEKTAEANLGLAEQMSAQVARSGSPLFNKALIAFKKGVQGDADTAKFVNALTAARNEYAKVLSSATGAQGITDSSRKEAADLFDKIDSHEMLVQTIGLARQEMANRMKGFDGQIAELQPGIGASDNVPTAPSAAAPAGVTPFTDAEKEARYQAWKKAHPNG